MRRKEKILLRFLSLLLFAGLIQPARTAYPEDRDFVRFVKVIESQFHVKRTHVPLLGAARAAEKLARTCGAKVLDIAIFEGRGFSGMDSTEFSEVADKALGREWYPLVRVVSHRDEEQTLIYSREIGEQYGLIIATLEPDEAVLIQVKMNSQDLFKFIDSPGEMGKAGKWSEEEDKDE